MWNRLRQKLQRYQGTLYVAPLIASLVILLRSAGGLQLLEWIALNQFWHLYPAAPEDPRIILVTIDETDIQYLGHWPISDEQLAQLIQTIKQQNPQAIGLDLYRDLPVEPGHAKLLQVFRSTPNLVGTEKVGSSAFSPRVAPPPVLKELDRVGANDILQDADGTARRAILYVTAKDGNEMESLSLRLALLYLKPYGIVPEPAPQNSNYLKLGKGIFRPFEADDGGYVRADAKGYQTLVKFRGPPGSFQRIAATDVLNHQISPTLMQGKIVLIGSIAESSGDFFITPHSYGLLGHSFSLMSGVELNAHLVSQILDQAFSGQSFLNTWSKPLEFLWIGLWAILGVGLGWWQCYHNNSLRWLKIGLIFAVASGSLVGIAYLAFCLGWWIPVVPPLFALIGSGIVIVGNTARTTGYIRQLFGRYLTDHVVTRLLENPEHLKLGGVRRLMTILASDLRGFTSLSERIPAEEVIKILNFYFSAMADVVLDYGGTIDAFIGDGMLILFGAPTSQPDDAQRAVACAIAMQQAMVKVNHQLQTWKLPALEMGIGMNTGEVVVGNIGSEKRTQYGVIGDQVNLAFRIESCTIGGQILISYSTLEAAGEGVQAQETEKVQLKGIQQPIGLYEVQSITGDYNLSLTAEEEQFFDFTLSIPVEYSLLEGKQISGSTWKGHLVKMSKKSVILQPEVQNPEVLPLCNLKLKILNAQSSQEEFELYGKVLKNKTKSPGHYIRLTQNSPADTRKKLNLIYQIAQKQTNLPS